MVMKKGPVELVEDGHLVRRGEATAGGSLRDLGIRQPVHRPSMRAGPRKGG